MNRRKPNATSKKMYKNTFINNKHYIAQLEDLCSGIFNYQWSIYSPEKSEATK